MVLSKEQLFKRDIEDWDFGTGICSGRRWNWVSVRYKNNGNVVLENPELIFEYPEHSLLQDNEELRQTQKVEDIYPGEEKSVKFKARFLGKENEIVIAQSWLSYQPKNLKARYESKTTFSTQIKFVPLTFEFDLP